MFIHNTDGDELADRALAQEEDGKGLLQQIEDSKVGERQFEQALTEFIAAIREHIEFEQNEVWPRSGEAQGPERPLPPRRKERQPMARTNERHGCPSIRPRAGSLCP